MPPLDTPFRQFQYPTSPEAVFDEQLVRTYRVFLDRRHTLRPEVEYREPADQEWAEFQQYVHVHVHVHELELELGECGRPYGTPCKHEHACVRCPSLRLDPRARPRLVEIIANLNDRIQDAKNNGWLGEVQGFQTSLKAAADKLVNLDRMSRRNNSASLPIAHLGIPVIKERHS